MRHEWEAWETVMTRAFLLTDRYGETMTAPFSAQAGSFDEANVTMLVHLGVLLRQEGHHPAWLREDD